MVDDTPDFHPTLSVHVPSFYEFYPCSPTVASHRQHKY